MLPVMPSDGSQSPRRRKMFAVAGEIGLTDAEQIELAQYLLRRDITSRKDLSEEQVARMLDALEGYELVSALLAMRSGAEQGEDSVVA